MITFDDFESTNARAWDDDTDGDHLPRAIAEVQSEPRERKNENRSVSRRRVRNGRGDTARATPARSIPKREIARRVNRPDLIPQERRRNRQQGRPTKDQTEEKPKWAKQGAVNTKRMQDQLDREALRAAKSAEFLSLPDGDKFLAEGYYFWSDSSVDLNSLLGENLELLDEIRSSCEVYIDFIQDVSCIRLRSKFRRNIDSGIVGVRAKIQHARANAAALAPIYVVEPPAVHAIKSKISPSFQESRSVRKTPPAMKAVISGSALTSEQLAIYEGDRDEIIKHNRERIFDRVVTALKELGPLKKPMSMRSNLGQIMLLQVRNGFKQDGCSFRMFADMMEEARTTAKFERMLGGGAFTGKILECFSTGSSLFDPTHSLSTCLTDVEAKHSLEVIAHGSSRQSVRIEADIDMVHDGAGADSQKSRYAGWQIGTVKFYECQHGARKTRLAIGILSLECNFDTCLEVTTDETILKLPKVFKMLVSGTTISGTSRFAAGNQGFNYPTVKLLVPEGLVVEEVRIKSAFHYGFRTTPYIVEITVHHQWKGANTKQKPLTSCSISLFHKDWDLLLTPDEGFEGFESLEMKSLFPDEPGVDDGLARFLAHVQTLQRYVSRAETF